MVYHNKRNQLWRFCHLTRILFIDVSDMSGESLRADPGAPGDIISFGYLGKASVLLWKCQRG